MAELETADRKPSTGNPEVRLNGRLIDLGDRKFDARAFAATLRKRKRKPRMTLSERAARMKEMEAKVAAVRH